MGLVIIDTLIDLIKIVPFLFLAFLIMEYLEHGLKSQRNILKNKKVGPLVGSFLGVIPQCGFGALATNLFASRVITLGTLLAVYLSTSDEMLPLLITGGASFRTISLILLVKVMVAIFFGYIIDFFFKKDSDKNDFSICEEEDCHCNSGIIKSSLIHTLKISFFILITTLMLNIVIHYIGEDNLGKVLQINTLLGPFLASLIGLIPNCAASVLVTELYLKKVITTGMLIGGLLTGAGVSLLILFKVNKNFKENIFILISLYLIGALVGLLIDCLGVII